MKTSSKDISNEILLHSFNDLKGSVDHLKDSVHDLRVSFQEMFEALQMFASNSEKRFSSLETKVDLLESRTTSIESKMVTKDYLDDKLADLRGDLVLLARKSNRKLETVIEELVANHSLKRSVADKILALEPFGKV